MSNTLGSILTGFNNGVNTGLTLYKTVQDEAPQKRQEEYTRERDALADRRWDMTWERQGE